MGRNRSEHQKQPAKKISLALLNEFSITNEEAYLFFEQYQIKKSEGMKSKDIIKKLFYEYCQTGIYNYFVALAMEMLCEHIIEGITDAE